MYQTLSTTTYNIVVGKCYPALKELLVEKKYSQHFILVDENTEKDCLPILLQKLPLLQKATIIRIQSGEIHKNLETCQYIWQQLLVHHADRKAVVLNLGGGVIGDMGGFSAATYKRGIDFVQIPTTLLAQVDASIGGKLGVDFANVKNIIGCFQNPQMVCIDPFFLKTLPKRQVYNGFAEIIKHALIADADYWEELTKITRANFEQTDWVHIILRSLAIKKRVVETDPYEQGLRKILNFGHTIGHAIESYSLTHDEDPLLHGEAIAVGMLAELYLSVQYVGLAVDSLAALKEYLMLFYSESFVLQSKEVDKEEILAYLKNDKKNTVDEHKQFVFNFTLIPQIGQSVYDQEVDATTIQKAIIKVKQLFENHQQVTIK